MGGTALGITDPIPPVTNTEIHISCVTGAIEGFTAVAAKDGHAFGEGNVSMAGNYFPRPTARTTATRCLPGPTRC